MNPIAQTYWTAKGVGFDNVPRRLLQAWRTRTGWVRRQLAPSRFSDDAFNRANPHALESIKEKWTQRATRFLPIPDGEQLRHVATPEQWDKQVTSVCESALAGRYPYFSGWDAEIGWPPRFNRDPVHGHDWPVGKHWLETARSGPPHDDIKFVWEPNRLTLAYFLARAYRWDGDEKWVQAFWQLFESWTEQNPAQLTVAWGCGQETAFRLMALLTGTIAVFNSPHTTEERLKQMTRFAWLYAKRIEVNLNYAISQENNHGMSEALGLWTVGVLFNELNESTRWRDHGARTLASECKRQIYDDGSFVQHSMSYHRVMLDDLMWCLSLSRSANVDLPTVIHDRFKRATDWLVQLIDPASGRVPNYGSNDGANVLPLACADYLDYRPTLQAASRLAHGRPALPPGVWDEKTLWLLPDAADIIDTPDAKNTRALQSRGKAWTAPDGGYHVLRGEQGWLMVRAATYRDRPGQADELHLDLWHQGVNVLRDGGSYKYYDTDDHWKHYFHSTAAHNTPQPEGMEQMTKGPRFLWFHWPKANGEIQAMPNAGQRFEGKLTSKAMPGITVTRTIEQLGDVYRVTDKVQGARATVRWRLCPQDWKQTHESWSWQTSIGGEDWTIQLSGDQDSTCKLTEGWESLYYGKKSTLPVIEHQGVTQSVAIMGPTAQVQAFIKQSD